MVPSVSSSPTAEEQPASESWFDQFRPMKRWDPDTRMGHPLRETDYRIWAPALMETGDMDQAMAIAVGSGAPSTSYGLFQLGDINGDGKGDFLLETNVVNGDEATTDIAAVSGADYKAIWTKTVPPKTYWYRLDDVNADEISDLVFQSATTTGTAASQGQNGVYASRSEYVTQYSYQVLSGKDGAVHADRTCKSNFNYTSVRASTPVGGSAQMRDQVFSYCGLSDLDGTGGFEVFMDALIQSTGPSVNALVAGGSANIGPSRSFVQRFGTDGKLLWAKEFREEQAYLSQVDDRDYTGDGLSDLVFMTYPRDFGYVYNPVEYVFIPNPLKPKLFVADGKTGALAWTMELDQTPLSEMDIAPAGSLDGKGLDFIVAQYAVNPAPSMSVVTTLTQVDGATGSKLSTKTLNNMLALAYEFADADKDGKDDLQFLSAPVTVGPTGQIDYPEEADFAVVKADYSPIWGPVHMTEDSFFGYGADTDFDGDAVPDFMTYDYSDSNDGTYMINVTSGATGKPMWSYGATHQVRDVSPIDDVNGDGGADLAITVVEAPAPKKKSQPSAQPIGGGSATSTASPSSTPEINYADFPAYVEIRQGSDKELVWRKQIHDPTKIDDLTSTYPYANVLTVEDTNANGNPDVLYTLDSYYFSNDEDAVPPKLLEFALVLEGADGTTLKAYPDSKASNLPVIVGKAANDKTRLKGAPQEPGLAPGLELLLVAAGLVGAAWARRRHA